MGFFENLRRLPDSPKEISGGSAIPLPADSLVPVTELAGFLAAHAVWCVSEGETLIPLAAFENDEGRRTMHRFAVDRIEQAVAVGEKFLAEHSTGARRAAFILDAFVTLETGKTDALIVKVWDYADERTRMQWVILYRSPIAPGGFAVHRPMAMYETQDQASHAVALADAFWRGVGVHKQGAAVWINHLDEGR